jgi:hypothetical protein
MSASGSCRDVSHQIAFGKFPQQATYRKGDAPWLVCTELRADDPEAIFTRDEFKALAWTTANAKAREMGWIV